MNRFRAEVCALAIVLAASGCKGGGPSGRAPEARAGVQLVPAGSARFFAFDADAVREQDREKVIATRELGTQGAGQPMSSGVDLVAARALVAYERSMARVNLEDGTWTWTRATWSKPPAAIAVAGGRAALHAQGPGGEPVVQVVDLVKGGAPTTQEVGPWLKSHGLRTLLFAAPVQGHDDQLVLVAAKYPRVVLKRVTDAKGEWRDVGGDEVGAEMNSVHRCASDGKRVVLAGVHESSGLDTRGKMVLKQDFVLIAIDLESGERMEILKEGAGSEDFREADVLDLAVAGDLVVLLRKAEDGREQVRAYRISPERGGAATFLEERWVAGGSSVVCVDAEHYAVLTEGRIDVRP